jgi:hypothetical protein
MKFSLATIAYVFALLAAGMAAFGPGWGILAASVGLAYWTWFFAEPPPAWRSRLFYTAVFLTALLLIALLLPLVASVRERSRHAACQSNLRFIALAVMSHSMRVRPPLQSSMKTGDGVAQHSWRIVILPYLEERALFEQYNFDEPWDGPNNSVVAATGLAIFQCPSSPAGGASTSYFAVVDPRAAWTEEGLRSSGRIRDGSSNTIMLIEAPERQEPWAKPVDLTFEEAMSLLCDPPRNDRIGHRVEYGYFYRPSHVLHVAMCSGVTRGLRLPLLRSLAEALLTADGREPINERELSAATDPEVDYRKCYAFGAFVALTALPAVRLLRAEKRSEDTLANRDRATDV